MSTRLFACALAWLLAATGPSALAAGMATDGTKNFTPSPTTPSYFTGERDIPYAGPQEFPAPAQPAVRGAGSPPSTSAAAPAGGQRDLYARPAEPTQEAAVRPHPTRPAHAWSRHYRTRAESARGLRLHRLRALRLVRLRRLRAVRVARTRYRRAWRR